MHICHEPFYGGVRSEHLTIPDILPAIENETNRINMQQYVTTSSMNVLFSISLLNIPHPLIFCEYYVTCFLYFRNNPCIKRMDCYEADSQK